MIRFFSKISLSIFAFEVIITLFSVVAYPSEQDSTLHYPLKIPVKQEWSFSGLFGKWDQGQLQRGFKIYVEVCGACHSLDLVSYRNLEQLGYSEAQVKEFASEYTVVDGPNDDGEMFDRSAQPSDFFSSPYENKKAAISSNNGALPPDMSLLAKARAPSRGGLSFILDLFTIYAEHGPDYIYSLLTGYQDAPEGTNIDENLYYNPYYIGGDALAMAPPLYDQLISYDDGMPETVDQYAKDISAFLMWTAEPGLAARKQRGFVVILFLMTFAGLVYYTKKRIWSNVVHC
ncbi:cytochrome c1 [Candidatus Endowatersipora endosymbiont of Watersipora subatra]|uniref:cytochrome c1 n=1 Tax=Candidatus Endowatersipora endosymbiont of Watersipora subatra TaxID=3077946 RepID=UPI00312CB13D